MPAAPLPENEFDRLAQLCAYEILDTGRDPRFERIISLAAAIFEVPICLVSLVDGARQWFKAKIGLSETQTPRDVAFCGHTILSDEALVIEDAKLDPRFADNPLVTGAPYIRFYAGAPLIVATGYRLGTLCIIDTKPRSIDISQVRQLKALAAVVADSLDIHKQLHAVTEGLSEAKVQAKERNLLISSISHELRTPLHLIVGYAEMIEGELLGSLGHTKYKEYAKFIRQSGHHLSELIDSALQIGKSGYGINLQRDEIDLNFEIESLAKTFEGAIANKNQQLVIEQSAQRICVYGNRRALRQITINLISNASKYSPSGATISVRVSGSDRRGYLSVTDTGPGMPGNVLKSLGQPFITGRQGGGDSNGLGLRITKQLADAMKGVLSFKTPISGGTQVDLALPICVAKKWTEPAQPFSKRKKRAEA
jgi:signal transduction histidine kinase